MISAKYNHDEIGFMSGIKYLETEEDMLRKAEQGGAWAQINLYHCYCLGSPHLPKNGKKAVEWLTKAAKQGYARAMFMIARGYEDSCFCYNEARDREKANEWYAISAEQGDAEAQYIFATRFLNEQDFSKDERKALEWLGRAAAQGYHKAIEMIKDIKAGKPIMSF